MEDNKKKVTNESMTAWRMNIHSLLKVVNHYFVHIMNIGNISSPYYFILYALFSLKLLSYIQKQYHNMVILTYSY